jgi:hypothetical protein
MSSKVTRYPVALSIEKQGKICLVRAAMACRTCAVGQLGKGRRPPSMGGPVEIGIDSRLANGVQRALFRGRNTLALLQC